MVMHGMHIRLVHVAEECEGEASKFAHHARTLQDEYNEVVSLGEVRLLVGEWVPFGDNAVASMMEKLGCQDRVQGGYFSDVIDSFPSEERLETPSGLTGVRILEFDLLNFVNFEADIHFAEDEGIVQVENFGTHVRSDGFVLYGIKIEAIMDHGADNVSLDLMSRLLMDIQNDSTRIIDSLVSEYQVLRPLAICVYISVHPGLPVHSLMQAYSSPPHALQRSMLDVVFYGDRESRDKFNIVLSEMINPKMNADLYLDSAEHESEIKQVIFFCASQSLYPSNRATIVFVGQCSHAYPTTHHLQAYARADFLSVLLLLACESPRTLPFSDSLVHTLSNHNNAHANTQRLSATHFQRTTSLKTTS